MHTPAHTATFAVTGMSCGHCERAIRNELATLPQLTVTQLEAATGTLIVSSEAAVAADLVIAAVAEAGYDATLSGAN